MIAGRQRLADGEATMKFSHDAMLNAAAVVVAGRLQAGATAGSDNVSQMLVQAMTEVLGGIEMMEEQAKSENMDVWSRLGDG
jgi:hypothetical protein